MDWLIGIIGFVAGSCFGFVIAAILSAAKHAEPPTISDIEARLRGDS